MLGPSSLWLVCSLRPRHRGCRHHSPHWAWLAARLLPAGTGVGGAPPCGRKQDCPQGVAQGQPVHLPTQPNNPNLSDASSATLRWREGDGRWGTGEDPGFFLFSVCRPPVSGRACGRPTLWKSMVHLWPGSSSILNPEVFDLLYLSALPHGGMKSFLFSPLSVVLRYCFLAWAFSLFSYPVLFSTLNVASTHRTWLSKIVLITAFNSATASSPTVTVSHWATSLLKMTGLCLGY